MLGGLAGRLTGAAGVVPDARLWSPCSSSSARFALAGRSKVLLELEDPVQELFGFEFSVHSALQ